MSPSRDINVEHRRRARRRALQALYQWQVKAETESADYLIEQFLKYQDFSQVDQEYFNFLLHGVIEDVAAIDSRLQDYLDRPLGEIDHIERAILRLAGFELLHSPDVPALVIVDEAIELAHHFGAEHGHTYVNAVLDKAAKHWRASELGLDP